jgi:DNA repair protein RadC
MTATKNQINSEDPAGYDAGNVPTVTNAEKIRAYEDRQIEEALRILEGRFGTKGGVMSSPDQCRAYLKLKLAGYPYEVFGVMFLDNRHRLIAFEEMFRGTIDGASVYPREVVKCALKHNAAAVVFAHNHPSGVTEPSQSDLRITERLKNALALVEVRVLDHMIVGEGDGVSLAERGLI